MSAFDDRFNANYNKIPGVQGVLVGNWYEERALKTVTGETRSKQWVSPVSEATEDVPEPMHTRWKGHPDLEDTTSRVFLHTDFVEPKDFTPTSRAFRTDRWQRYESAKAGPRAQMREAAAMAQARAELEAEELAREEAAAKSIDPRSEMRASFDLAHARPVPLEERGRRIMKTQSGGEARRDPTWLVEAGLLQPHLAKDVDISGKPLPAQFASYVDSVAAPGQTKGPGATSFSRTRNDDFSKPIEVYMKPGAFRYE